MTNSKKKVNRELKIDLKKCNETSKRFLSRLFKEAVWFINHALDERYAFHRIITENVIVVPIRSEKDDECFEQVEIECLSLGMRKSILYWIDKQAKENQEELPFVNSCSSIALRYGRDYWLDVDNKQIKIAGLEQQLKVRGMKNIAALPADCKFVTAYLRQQDGKYYLTVRAELQEH